MNKHRTNGENELAVHYGEETGDTVMASVKGLTLVQINFQADPIRRALRHVLGILPWRKGILQGGGKSGKKYPLWKIQA